jgi:hypothetical protein
METDTTSTKVYALIILNNVSNLLYLGQYSRRILSYCENSYRKDYPAVLMVDRPVNIT